MLMVMEYDGMDICPTEAETWNRYIDHDGCPDVIPTVPGQFDSDKMDYKITMTLVLLNLKLGTSMKTMTVA